MAAVKVIGIVRLKYSTTQKHILVIFTTVDVTVKTFLTLLTYLLTYIPNLTNDTAAKILFTLPHSL